MKFLYKVGLVLSTAKDYVVVYLRPAPSNEKLYIQLCALHREATETYLSAKREAEEVAEMIRDLEEEMGWR